MAITYFRVEFSTKLTSHRPGELRRLQMDIKAEDARSAESTVTGRFSDASKIETRAVNRAERIRSKKLKG